MFRAAAFLLLLCRRARLRADQRRAGGPRSHSAPERQRRNRPALRLSLPRHLALGRGSGAAGRAHALAAERPLCRRPRHQPEGISRGHGGAEADLYAGYGTGIAPGTTLDAGVIYYWFPGRARARATMPSPMSRSPTRSGRSRRTLGAKYAWSQRAIGSTTCSICSARSRRAFRPTPLTLTAEAGRQESGRARQLLELVARRPLRDRPARGGPALRRHQPALAPPPGRDAGRVAGVWFYPPRDEEGEPAKL